MKNGYEVTLNVSSNVIGNSNDETNFPYKLLLTDTQVKKTRNALQMAHQLILNFQKLNCLRSYSQEDLIFLTC